LLSSFGGFWDDFYGFSEKLDLRIAYQFPFSRSEELNSGLTTGLLYHF
jgi:hypothetical protein